MHPVLVTLRSVFDRLSDAVIITQAGHGRKILYANEAAAKLFHCGLASLIGSEQTKITGRLPESFDGTLRVKRQNGESFTARWSQSPYPSDKPDFIISIIVDVTTAQKIAVAAAELDDIISRGKQQIVEQRAIRQSLRQSAAAG